MENNVIVQLYSLLFYLKNTANFEMIFIAHTINACFRVNIIKKK